MEDLTVTVQILLNIIQPYMIRSNLLIPAVRKNIILSEGLTQRRSDSICKSLPSIFLLIFRTLNIKEIKLLAKQDTINSYQPSE